MHVTTMISIPSLYFYSQTCLNNYLHKTTTRLRRPVLSPPKQIPIQSLLYKTTTGLTQPATTFFLSPKWKKPVYNDPNKTLRNEEMGSNHGECIKSECLLDYIYSVATL